jgi:hypothetical protein
MSFYITTLCELREMWEVGRSLDALEWDASHSSLEEATVVLFASVVLFYSVCKQVFL